MENDQKELIFKKSVNILIVDDREDNLLSIESILEKDGYTIVKANSGRAALKILLQQWDFQLILMDVQMPGMSGLETATLISQREKLKHIPIIFITAFNHEEKTIFQGYEMGGVDYIYKPIDPELLRVKVGVFVELYRKTHQLLLQEKKLLNANKRLLKEVEERKISEEKIRTLNLQLIRNNDHLKMTNEELDRFAYVASHDLQEPLRKISIFTDRFFQKMGGTLDNEVKIYLEKITQSSHRMQMLVNDLLKFSRQKEEHYNFQKTDLNIILKEVLSDMEVDIESKNAKIVYNEMPVLDAIPGLIRQLFQNLISNSLKFSKADTLPFITITAEKVIETAGVSKHVSLHDHYSIRISDNGIGFDEVYLEEIFMVFKRLHSHHIYKGSGIGLSICKKIVEKHYGTITAESKNNEGATFVVTLPVDVSKVELLAKDSGDAINYLRAN